MMRAPAAIVLALSAFALTGCNAIFGIDGGQPSGGAGGSGATSGTGAAGGTGGATGGTGAAGGAAGCPPDKPAQCDAKYLQDADNCCVAGRSCGKGTCQDGECAPAKIGQSGAGEEAISAVVVVDHVIWSSGYAHGLYRVDTAGDAQESLFNPAAAMFEDITMLAADPDPSPAFVYFTNYNGPDIGRAPVDGGPPDTFAKVPDAGNLARYGSILVHGDHVYWAMQRESVDSPMDPGKDIWRAKRHPGNETAVTAEKVIEDDRPLGLAADDGYLYFGDSKQGTIGRVAWASLGEGASLPAQAETLVASAIAGGQTSVGELAVDDKYVYWGSGTVLLGADKTKPSASGQTLHTASSYLGGVIADGRDVYFTTLGDSNAVPGELWRKPGGIVGGMFPKKLFEAPPPDGGGSARSIPSLTQDCGHVYFLVREGGELWKLTK